MHVIETMRIEDKHIPRFDLHQRRIRQAAHYFDIPFQEEAFQSEVEAVLNQIQDDAIYRLKVTLDQDGRLESAFQRMQPTAYLTATYGELNENVASWKRTYKTSERAHLAFDQPTDLILLYDANGKVLEFNIGNVAIEEDQNVYTPVYEGDFLNGCMRQALLNDKKITERNYTITEIIDKIKQHKVKLYMLNSLREMVDVKLELKG
ncbi:aminotransferase class IV [Staphylococcus massiliensis]|uniref:aminotransferase class IV n=1 Tax=Staphylococcus massiliensis TaxID=555791 RepID=UPI001EDDED62|nr:aminotransferase class IV [Staphylococcus massiliensis]MCG3400106.1 aminotransferase class IV [Staphylococcus massiliensis]MCG3413160.1 aminotransferase class IV [Staphylococcus massiliensis]